MEEVSPLPPANKVVGVDLGLRHYATLSTGEQIDNPRHYRRAERKLRRLQRALSRKQKGSANRQEAREKLALHHERVANMRQDFQQKLATRLIHENQGIGVETLSVKGLARTHLAKSMHDAGFGELLRQLQYKATWYGHTLVAAPRFYPSTKTCHQCGHVVDVMPLRQREFCCAECGLQIDRDLNAALNLAAVATGQMETLNACGDECQTQKACATV
jgi:putative transposase